MGSSQFFRPLTMDWREYIQEKEEFAMPQRGHLAALLAAMQARPGATPEDDILAAPRREEEARRADLLHQYANRVLNRRVSEMSFEDYKALQYAEAALVKAKKATATRNEAAHSF